MKQEKKTLKTLLKGGFTPLEVKKEGGLHGGFGEVATKNGNCANCGKCPPPNSFCPQNKDCKCPLSEQK